MYIYKLDQTEVVETILKWLRAKKSGQKTKKLKTFLCSAVLLVSRGKFHTGTLSMSCIPSPKYKLKKKVIGL